MRARDEFQRTEDILNGLLEYWEKQDLSDEQQNMLVQTMRWSYTRGILAEAMEQTLMHRILNEEDEEDEL